MTDVERDLKARSRPVLWQRPNMPIFGWLIFKLLAYVTPFDQTKIGLDSISRAFLFTWAYLEIAQGVNTFRKALGVIVMIATIFSLLII